MEKVTADTSVLQDKLEQVKQLMPEVFTENKFDYDKFKGFFAEEIDDRPERYSFTWAGRREAIRLLQAKSRAALIPAKAESVNFDDTKNVFIEGDNLEVLKLLRSSYFNRVKMIYIDPPYNTGNDFIYPDDFKDPLAVYQQITGQKDEQGNVLTTNSETSGRYHSAWLTMMYPRLFIARQLLKEDGVIFISIDDHEVHNLRMIMNEIFGEENFVAVIPWRKRTAKSDVPFGISQDYEWIIVYAKADFFAGIPTNRVYHHTDDYDDGWRLSDLTKQCTKDERPKSFFDMVNPKNGEVFTANPNRVWAVTDNTFDSYYKKGKIVFPGDYSFLNITKPAYRVFEREDKEKNLERFGSEEPLASISTLLPPDIGRTEDGTKEITGLFGAKVFPFPKPSSLIKYLIQIVNDKNAIVLDFFAGSATTAQAVLELNREDDGNRNFVLVQLPEVGGNGYDTLADISKERIRRVIKMQNGTLPPPPDAGEHSISPAEAQDLGFKVFKLDESHWKQWDGVAQDHAGAYMEQLEMFADPLVASWTAENLIYEVAIKEGLSLNIGINKVSDTDENTIYAVSDPETERSFYICLDDKIKLEAVTCIKLTMDDTFVCRAVALDDTTAANVDLQCRLKTI